MAISISSAADLAKIGVEPSHPLDGEYVLENDIALSGQWTPIAPVTVVEGVPVLDNKFTGTFDGNGKTISGLYIEDLTDGACCKALFGCIWGGVVKRLKLRGSVTLKNEEGGGMYVGGLACVLASGGIIEENDIGVDVTGLAYVAPICPFILSGGSIVNNRTSGTVTATVFASGVCVGVADFEATKDVAYISKNVFVGTMNFTGDDPAYYGVGMICFSPVLADPQIYFASDRCYWDYELSPYTNSYVGEHKTTAELKQQATFVHWNFESVWKIDAGEYPELQCFVNAVVPDVEGMTQAAAVAAIEAVGLVVSTATAYNADFASGLVCQQLPAADTTVAVGSTVSIVTSLGVEQKTVPNVVGLTQAAAESAITGVSLVPSATTANSNTVAIGKVISQNPASGTSVDINSTVDIVVSLGALVPDIVGDYYLGAKSIVEAQSLVYASTMAYSATVASGYIISQSPAAGASVAPGSTITATVSRGAQVGPLMYTLNTVKTVLSRSSAFRAWAGVATEELALGHIGILDMDADYLPMAVISPGNWEREVVTLDGKSLTRPAVVIEFCKGVTRTDSDATVFATLLAAVDSIMLDIEAQGLWINLKWAPLNEDTPRRAGYSAANADWVGFSIVIEGDENEEI